MLPTGLKLCWVDGQTHGVTTDRASACGLLWSPRSDVSSCRMPMHNEGKLDNLTNTISQNWSKKELSL